MTRSDEILTELRDYISREILEGKDIGLDASTPLLEYGIINSLEITRLITFIHQRFEVKIVPNRVMATHFKSLASLSALVVGLYEERAAKGTSRPLGG
jgi:acyl carrier protein